MNRTIFILCILLSSYLHGMGEDSIQNPNFIYFGSFPTPFRIDPERIQEMRRQLARGTYRIGPPIEQIDPNEGAGGPVQERLPEDRQAPPVIQRRRATRQRRFGIPLQHGTQRRFVVGHPVIDTPGQENLDPTDEQRNPLPWETGEADIPHPFEGEGGAILHPFEEGDGNDGEFDIEVEDRGREVVIHEPLLGRTLRMAVAEQPDRPGAIHPRHTIRLTRQVDQFTGEFLDTDELDHLNGDAKVTPNAYGAYLNLVNHNLPDTIEDYLTRGVHDRFGPQGHLRFRIPTMMRVNIPHRDGRFAQIFGIIEYTIGRDGLYHRYLRITSEKEYYQTERQLRHQEAQRKQGG